MLNRMALVAAVLVLCIVGLQRPALSQPADHQAQGASRADAMAKLNFLHGEWEGDATFEGPGGTQRIRQREWVSPKVGGSVLLIEGQGRVPQDDGQGRIVFEALATITFDPAENKFIMRAHSREGMVDPWIEVKDRGVDWGFTVRGMQIRYQISLDERGHWIEKGERSMDEGKTWIPFIQMDLARKQS